MHEPTEHISIEQLCVGLYIHLDIGWINHPFSRNSFKIGTAKQLATLSQIGLTTIRFDQARSDCQPLPLVEDGEEEVEEEADLEARAEEAAALGAKVERIEVLKQQRSAVARCAGFFAQAAGAAKDLSRNLFSRPKESREEAGKLIHQMLGSLLQNKDAAIHLMNDKISGQEGYFHSLNVSMLAMMLAKEMKMSDAEVELIGVGGLFHDIGKRDIPDSIKTKREPLTNAERGWLELHCLKGEEIAHGIGFPKEVIEIIVQHHECVDGSGYPKRLRGAAISPMARVVAIVNVYDNLCNPPNPADAQTPSEALSHMFKHYGKQLDSGPLQLFIRCLGLYPPGTIVRLSDETLGMVVAANAAAPMRPTIVIYDKAIPKKEAIILDLQREPELKVSECLKPSQLPREVFEYLSPRG